MMLYKVIVTSRHNLLSCTAVFSIFIVQSIVSENVIHSEKCTLQLPGGHSDA